jgi:hypothetical protein
MLWLPNAYGRNKVDNNPSLALNNKPRNRIISILPVSPSFQFHRHAAPPPSLPNRQTQFPQTLYARSIHPHIPNPHRHRHPHMPMRKRKRAKPATTHESCLLSAKYNVRLQSRYADDEPIVLGRKRTFARMSMRRYVRTYGRQLPGPGLCFRVPE